MFSLQTGFKPDQLEKVKDVGKQVRFALATTLTALAQEGQAASVAKARKTFTIRTAWLEKGNRFGIKVVAAKKDNLNAFVTTLAWWLLDHESGGERAPQRNFIAVPTDNVRRTKRDLISLATRKKLLDKSNPQVFRLQTKRGKVLATRARFGKNTRLQVLFGLEKKTKIKKEPTFFDEIRTVATNRFGPVFHDKFTQAIGSAK